MTIPSSDNEPTSHEEVPFNIGDLPRYIRRYIADVLDLKKGVEPLAVIEEIKTKRSLAGANAWMLMCSIVIASIGLSQNSQAVIIGAMLISPLMSPILGIGLSIGINDMETLRGSFAHFSIAIVIALLTSYIYFSITPFNDLTSEIVARTKPTFLDIFVAIFGGLAGIISTSRKDISTTIPGVAIATALMPPLCVTGYGMAIGNFDIASKAFYYFFLNTFFVALATYTIVKFLQFPLHKYSNKRVYRKNLIFIITFSLALVIPSFFIFRNVFREQRLDSNLKLFKEECLRDKSIYLDSYNTDVDDSGNNVIYLKVYGNAISIEDKDVYMECLSACGIQDHDLKIISTSNVNIDQIEILEHNLERIHSEIEKNQVSTASTQKEVQYFKKALIDTTTFIKIQKEVAQIFPTVKEFGLAKAHIKDTDSTYLNFPTVLVTWEESRGLKIRENNKKLNGFLRERLELDTIKLISY